MAKGKRNQSLTPRRSSPPTVSNTDADYSTRENLDPEMGSYGPGPNSPKRSSPPPHSPSTVTDASSTPERTSPSFLQYHQTPSSQEEVQSLMQFQEEEEKLAGDRKDKDEEENLTGDVYSLLYTTRIGSAGFLFAATFFIMQTSFLWLLFLNFYDIKKPSNYVKNPMKVPPGVDSAVSIAQFLSVLVTVIMMVTSGDATAGIIKLVKGYDKKMLKERCKRIKKDRCHASFTKWLVTSLLQIFNGVMFLLVNITLTMQSTDVLEIILNLTGLVFLQEIDDLGFHFASVGILGEGLRSDCALVSNLKEDLPEKTKQRIVCARRTITLIGAVALIAPYSYYTAQQRNGKYVCSKMNIQFGGSFEKRVQPFNIQNRRPYYLNNATERQLQLAWCKSEEAWTVSLFRDESQVDNAACDYFFKSSKTSSFDVGEVAENNWFEKASPQDKSDTLVDWLKVSCNDQVNDNGCSTNSECQNGGFCHKGNCVCGLFATGDFCQNVYRCDERGKGCLNGGVCSSNKCDHCSVNFIGDLCQEHKNATVPELSRTCTKIICDPGKGDHDECSCGCLEDDLNELNKDVCRKVVRDNSTLERIRWGDDDLADFYQHMDYDDYMEFKEKPESMNWTSVVHQYSVIKRPQYCYGPLELGGDSKYLIEKWFECLRQSSAENLTQSPTLGNRTGSSSSFTTSSPSTVVSQDSPIGIPSGQPSQAPTTSPPVPTGATILPQPSGGVSPSELASNTSPPGTAGATATRGPAVLTSTPISTGSSSYLAPTSTAPTPGPTGSAE